MSVTAYVIASENRIESVEVPNGVKVRHDAPAFHDDGAVRVDDAAGKPVAFFSLANIAGVVVNADER